MRVRVLRGIAGGTAPTGYADKCLSATFDVTVTRATPVTLTTTLPVAGAVSGSLTDLSGAPVRGLRVHVTGSAADDYVNSGWILGGDTPKQYSRSGPDGTFLVDKGLATRPSASRCRHRRAVPRTTAWTTR